VTPKKFLVGNGSTMMFRFFMLVLLASSLGAQQSATSPQQGIGVNQVVSGRQQLPQPSAPVAAEKQALDQVSLSPDTIIDILTKEPGLFLEVKKSLVRSAFEQGRLLDPEELTDDAVLTMIREDVSARIIATKEVVDRYYVRAKPNKQELQDLQYEDMYSPYSLLQAQDVSGANASRKPGSTGTAQPSNQEDQFWQARDTMRQQQLQRQQQNQSTPSPSLPVQPNIPNQYPGYNPNVQINRARLSTEGQADEPYSSVNSGPGASVMQRLASDQMSSMLLPASSAGMQQGVLKSSTGGFQGLQAQSMQDAFGGSLSDIGASLLSQAAQSQQPVDMNQMANLDTRNQLPMRSLYPIPIDNHPIIRHKANPYANVPALYDLYSQVSKQQPVLERFGTDIFQNGSGNFDDLPMDLPVGPDYVLGPGDSVSVNLWGSISQRLQRVVDREGRLSLPQVGTVLVAGKSLGDAQHEVQSVLRTQFRDIQADISLARLRTVRVYVVGFVTSPGAYDISALSTPLNALIAAGGPTDGGSMRSVRHYRGKQLVQEVDLYDLILHGVRSDVKSLQPGDTILVAPLRKELTIEGMVRRPGVYELLNETSLADVLELAGGVLPSGTLRHIEVERLQAHQVRSMVSLDMPATVNEGSAEKTLDDFKVQEGDKIRISPIRPYSERTVYLDGHVFHPGKYPYSDGMKVRDLLKSYNDLLPEPYQKHAEIIRLEAPDYRPQVIPFNLADAMQGKEQNLALKPFDTIRIFGRFDFEDMPIITVSGEVRDPGDHNTNGVTHLSDAIYLAGGTTPDASLSDVDVYRKDGNSVRVMNISLSKALAGDPSEDIQLESQDRIIVHRNLAKLDPATVIVQGEVANPGKYVMGENMTAASLVRLAGGLKRGAFTQSADLARYVVENGSRVLSENREIPLGQALLGEADTDVRLHDGDVLTVRQLSNWTEVGSFITVKGAVAHPGGYGIQDGEHLSSIVQRAGGLLGDAYSYGAVLLRKEVRELEQKNQSELLARIDSQRLAIQAMPEPNGDAKLAKEAALQQWQVTVDHLRSSPPTGRVVIHISNDVHRWANTPNDIVVKKGDVLIIPKQPSSVLVAGQVFNPTAVSYRPGKSAKWYLAQSGGASPLANKKGIFVVKADGSVLSDSTDSGWWSGGALSASLQPGDAIFVPEKAVAGPRNWQPLISAAQAAASITIATSYFLK
jgi:protein involved in polysaccharide export with SLBB domain